MSERREYTREELDYMLGDPKPPVSLDEIQDALFEVQIATEAQTETLRGIDRSLGAIFVVLVGIAALLYRGVYGAWY